MQKLSYFWRGYYCEEDQEENIVVIHLEFDAFNVLKEEGKSKIQATGKD